MKIPYFTKALYMYFLTEKGYLGDFYKYGKSYEFVNMYAVNNSRFQKDFAALVLANSLFSDQGG